MDIIKSQELNLDNYQWHNRIILVVSKDWTPQKYIDQIQEFKHSTDELKERRLILIEVQKGKYRITNPAQRQDIKEDWQCSNNLYNRFFKNKDDFRVILIGLDGGIKLNKKAIVSKADLFQKIDSMPMRKAELKNKQNNK